MSGKAYMAKVARVPCVLIDDVDKHLLGLRHWIDSGGYVACEVRRGKRVRLHRLILPSPRGLVVDHINRNKLDNRRDNLRICQHGQNIQNAAVRKDNKVGIKGVYLDKRYGTWVAQIQANRKRFHIGSFASFDAAVEARLSAERQLHGEFARNGP